MADQPGPTVVVLRSATWRHELELELARLGVLDPPRVAREMLGRLVVRGLERERRGEVFADSQREARRVREQAELAALQAQAP